MKKYRKYLILLLKAVSYGIFMYSCLYMVSVMVFSIYLDRLNLPVGIIMVLIPMVLCTVSSKNPKAGIIEKYAMALGALLSCLGAFIFYIFLQNSTAVLVLSIPYYIYLWKLGWDLGGTGLSYDTFKAEFLTQFKILILPTIASAFFPGTVAEIGQCFTAFVIISPIILRYSRDYIYMKAQKSRKAYIINALSAAGMILVLFFVLSSNFIDNISILLIYIYIGADYVLTYAVKIIAYPIGYIVYLIILLVRMLVKPDAVLPELTDPGEDNKQPQDMSTFTIPNEVVLAFKIAIPLILAFILVRALSKRVNRIRKTDYTESREFVFKLDEVGRGLGKSISSVFKKRTKTEPKTLGERIRFLYSSFLEISIRKGIYKKGSETHREIEEKSLLYAKEAPDDIMHLTDVYEKARYSDNMLNEDDFDIAENSLKKIKELYEN